MHPKDSRTGQLYPANVPWRVDARHPAHEGVRRLLTGDMGKLEDEARDLVLDLLSKKTTWTSKQSGLFTRLSIWAHPNAPHGAPYPPMLQVGVLLQKAHDRGLKSPGMVLLDGWGVLEFKYSEIGVEINRACFRDKLPQTRKERWRQDDFTGKWRRNIPQVNMQDIRLTKPTRRYVGEVAQDGRVTLSVGPDTVDILAMLQAFQDDPAGAALAHGKRTGICCFCGLTLTDPTSTALGYGATCAKNWGLPYGEKSAGREWLLLNKAA